MEENGEEENGGASSAAQTEEKSRRSSSAKEDRISQLPDHIIHHILSLLPSTKQAIRTTILSKRWRNQWTGIQVLIFDSYSPGMSAENFTQFIDKTLALHACPKINKFSVHYDYLVLGSPTQLTSTIQFAITKHVEELSLHLFEKPENALPEFLFDNASLLKLELFTCDIWDDQRVNWSSLKELILDCSYVSNLGFGNIMSGCALLELLELHGPHDFVIASKSLKRLIFVDVGIVEGDNQIEISCPNLVELSVKTCGFPGASCQLPDKTIENVLSQCPLLHTLELLYFWCSYRFLIASKSLKKLVLGNIYGSEFEISCPKLEELNLYSFQLYVPTFDDFESESRWKQCFAMKMLQQVQHVKVLEIGCWFLKILSALDVEAPPSPLLNCKGLTLAGTRFDEQLSGIVYVIQNSHMLEKLEIKLHPSYQLRELAYIWDSNEAVFKCSVSNLKTVKIVGLSQLNEVHKIVFDFVDFLLKNARMLEKIFIILAAECGTDFLLEVSKKMISFQRCFPHITIELLRSNYM